MVEQGMTSKAKRKKSKKAVDKTPWDVADLEELVKGQKYSPEQEEKLRGYLVKRRELAKFSPTTESVSKDGTIELDRKSLISYSVGLTDATGFVDLNTGVQLMTQVLSTVSGGDTRTEINKTAAMMQELNPRTPEEGLLITQMIGTHNVAMKYLSLASKEKSLDSVKVCSNTAARFLRLFNEQLECLNKLRGKSGQQKVTVEHVHVNEGGQAIVGNIEGGGDQTKSAK